MQAVEFDTTINRDGFIKVPEKYKELRNVGNLRLVIMYDSDECISKPISREDMQRMDSVDMIFDKYKIDLSKFNFNRDEANER